MVIMNNRLGSLLTNAHFVGRVSCRRNFTLQSLKRMTNFSHGKLCMSLSNFKRGRNDSTVLLSTWSLKRINISTSCVETKHSCLRFRGFNSSICCACSYYFSTVQSFSSKPDSNASTSSDRTTILGQFPGGVPEPKPQAIDKASGEEKKDGRFTGKNIWKLGLIVMVGWTALTGGMLLYMWGSPHKTEDGDIIIDEFSNLPIVEQYFKRTWRGILDYKSYIQEPSSPKLLPDPLKEPYYQPPYTLVIELTGVLVHPDWTYKTGWRFKKRPGIEYLLQTCGPPNFEIVIFTQEQAFTAFPLIDSMDPKGYIMYRLFRDATRYMDGHHVKDLKCLNRDLSKVIFIDWNQKSFKLQPENAFPLQKWTGEDSDRKLFDLANFLSVVAASGVSDVREVLRHYSQFDDPLGEFRENQRRLQEQQEEKLRNAQQTDARPGLLPRKSLFSWR